MKKVAFIIPQIGKGGAERVAVHIANTLVERGHYVEIYTILSGDVHYPINKSIRHFYLNVEEKNKLVRIYKRHSVLRKLLKASPCETIISFDRNYGLFSSLGLNKKIIASERNDPYSNDKSLFEKIYRDWIYNKSDVIVFQTEYAQGYFSKSIKDKSVIIPNPISTDILPEPYIGVREKNICAIGRLVEQKNFNLLIDSFNDFHKVYGDYTLSIFGEGPLLDELTKKVISYGLEDYVLFKGYCTDVLNELNKSSMFVSSSDYEGISNAMLEALAIGVPTICTDCPAGGAKMSITDHVNGLLVPVGEKESLTKAMIEIVENNEQTQSFSSESIKIRDRFNADIIVDLWEGLL